ncbi:NAD(P)-dependent dehydrogenase (short-subunit alcohol dehydrogenase family) [Sphingomonas faeni]|uniref:NAD(P)-dependent dehydrogenase (Short-subunit alcohol dehydrogenase family) n=1 Tax=Sphingomonas faeni TaxID=185950 RepID=A0A2T5U7A3_9SPHN|nr:SDR family NAD(P)-dependent oxidoreductase [Sphingomonas faeni]PTW47348.1 NAD(P)-dependent dehydrogenase (short-subunit alcohol dehydrogenase family) [Sphingomonas faeni]
MPTILITGGHGGIGLACSKNLAAQYRTNLLLAGRSLERMEPVALELARTYGVKVNTLELDTSSLASVRAAAARCRALLDDGAVDSLQAILCNAGTRIRGLNYSVDGYEETFATNHLGHVLLLELLIDRVAASGRVVFTASGTHDPDTVDGKLVGVASEPDAVMLANEGKEGRKPISGGKRYSTSKLCNVLTAYELDRRLRRSGSAITSIAFDPGSTAGTGFLRAMPAPLRWLSRRPFFYRLQKRLGITMGSIEFSGASLARLAADPAFAESSGKYLQSNDGRLTETRSSAMSYDKARGSTLWDDSKLLVHLRPDEQSTLLR